MGVYIRGMEMPTSCWACACYHHKVDDGYYDYDVCQASGTVFNDGYSSATGHRDHIDPFKQRLDDCPLVPVPPHGDLIDRREAIIDANERAYDFWLSDDEVNASIQFLKEQPTIVPADPAEEGET